MYKTGAIDSFLPMEYSILTQTIKTTPKFEIKASLNNVFDK